MTTDAVVTKLKTASQLTEYYELRLAELMAVRHVLQNPEANSFEIKTNKGKVNVQITDVSETGRKIRITITRTERLFFASYFYDKEQRRFEKRFEYQ